MPFSPERTALIQARLNERLSKDELNEWERSFLTDMEKRFALYGMRTRLSERQYQKLHSLLDIPKHEKQSGENVSSNVVAMHTFRRETNRGFMRTSRLSRQSYKRKMRPKSPFGVIYVPKRAIRKVRPQLAVPILAVLGLFIGQIGEIFFPSTYEASHVPQSYQAQDTGIEGTTLIVTGTRVNQRTGPGTNNPVMGALSKGTPVKKVSSQGEWMQIRSSLGIGWMSSRYLSAGSLSAGNAGAAVKGKLVSAGAVRVIDGDTVAILGERANVRLVGFNTPEISSAACNREYALGQRAKSRLHELIQNSQRIEFQRVACACRPGTEGTKACNYGRECGSIRVDGRDVGSVLISEGLAVRYICGRTSCPRRPGNWCQ